MKSTVPVTSGLYYPNRLARLLLVAMHEVMGLHGLNTILSLADLESVIDSPPPDDLVRGFDFAAIAAINNALEDVYGARGGRGIALRVGRAIVLKGFNRFGALTGMSDPAFRKLTMDKQVRLGLEALAAVFNRFSDQASHITEDADHYYFHADPSPMTWGRSLDQPANHMLAGIIQETLRWATQGYEFHVQEQPPVHGASVTVFKINKKPIGGVSFG